MVLGGGGGEVCGSGEMLIPTQKICVNENGSFGSSKTGGDHF